MLHFSEIDKGLVNPLQHGYKTGDNIAVKYLGRNEVTGELRISRRVLFAPPTIKVVSFNFVELNLFNLLFLKILISQS